MAQAAKNLRDTSPKPPSAPKAKAKAPKFMKRRDTPMQNKVRKFERKTAMY